MRRILSFLLILSILFTMASFGCAFSEKDKEYGFVSSVKAKMYADAGLSVIKNEVSRYDIVTVIGKSSTALCVKVNGSDGYLSVRDVCMVENSEKTAVVNKASKVYIHPSTSARKASVSKGTVVNLITINGSWAMVEKNGTGAYIPKTCLTVSEGRTAPAGEPVKPEEIRGLTNAVACDFSAKVNVTTLSLYTKPSTSNSRITYMKSGTVVNVLAYNGTWAYVELNGKGGYCQRSYLKKLASAPAVSPAVRDNLVSCEPFTAVAVQSKVSIYEQPDASSKYLGYIVNGIEVSVDAYGETWCRITFNGRSGYACKSNFAIKNAPAATPAPTPAPTPSAKIYVSSDEIFTDTRTTNEQKVFLYLSRETDYNEAVACGIMASISAESRFNPASGKGKSYQGICQWSSSRFSLLTDWCSQNGFDPYSLEGQIKFLYYDLSQRYTVYHKALLAIENSADGAYQAGYYFCYHYERPASLESSSVKRGNTAKDSYWKTYME